LPASTVAGQDCTLKFAACEPEVVTPEMVSTPPPRLVMAKMWSRVPPATSTSPKSVPSDVVGIASPSAISARFVPRTSISRGVEMVMAT
jgi:hypothetical protein